MHGNPITTDPQLNNYAPSGLENLAAAWGPNRNLAYLCEGGVVAIMYDCNRRIPLYAATMMTGAQLNGGAVERASSFKLSNDLDSYYQQHDRDYGSSSDREICYETSQEGRLVDSMWYDALNYPKKINPGTKCDQVLTIQDKKVAIHKGHLIAARYGRGIPGRGQKTFTYTNVVPQFAKFNTGKWNFNEGGLETWGKKHCNTHNGQVTTHVRMYIIVGIIPSFAPFSPPRYFGQKGFSDVIDDSNYRFNVPRKMWTTACCTFQYQENGTLLEGTKHTAFSRDNNPSKQQCDTPEDMARFFQQYGIAASLFPAKPACSDQRNYVSMYE